MKKYIKLYREQLLYIFFGLLTTLVNYVSYLMFSHVLQMPVMPSNGLAFILAIGFAYLTNKHWVFTSHAKTKQDRAREAIMFFTARACGFLVDMSIMFIFVTWLGLNDFIMKGIANVVVILMNYIVSKYVVFSEKRYLNQNN